MLLNFDRRDATVFALLLAIGLALYAPVLRILPLDGDNLYALAWVDSARFGDLLRLDPDIYPEWRPLAYLSIWLEHRVVPLHAVGVHLFVNLVLWVSCAFMVYGIVRELTASLAAAVIAALFLLLDARAASALTWIIERQMLMALLLGVSALFIVTRARGRDATPREAVAVAALLLGSALSKEYGLACALAIIVFAIARNLTRLSTAALAACAIYGAMRLGFAGGAVDAYCEDMGWMFTSSFHCVNPTTMPGAMQVAYNAVAATVGSVFTGVFGPDGTVALSPELLLLSGAFVVLAAIGLASGPRVLVCVALLPLTTGVFNALIYRSRNVLIGVAATAILAGVGVASVRLQAMPVRLRARAALLAVLVVLLGAKAYYARLAVTQRVDAMLAGNPCHDDNYDRAIVEQFVRVVRETYALGDPGCRDEAASPPSTQ